MGMSKDRCPYNSFFGEKVMIKEKVIPDLGKVCKQGDDIVSDIRRSDDAGGLDFLCGFSPQRHELPYGDDLLSGGGDPGCICDKQDLGIPKLQFPPCISS